jgi:hypothetical protein
MDSRRLAHDSEPMSPSPGRPDVVDVQRDTCSQSIRVTALLGPDKRIAAAYWSLSYPTQDEQDAVKHDGHLEPACGRSTGRKVAVSRPSSFNY